MRHALPITAVLVVIAVLWGVSAMTSDDPGGQPMERTSGTDVPAHERIDRLEARLERLAEQMDLISRRVTALQTLPRAGHEASPAPAGPTGTVDPRWYLDQYILSFSDGGKGSEYFRLAVEAFALALVDDIGDVILNAHQVDALRVSLVMMFGKPQFVGNTKANATLLSATQDDETAVAASAIKALEAIGDLRTAYDLEAIIWRIENMSIRRRALALIIKLSGKDVNEALLRLMQSAPDVEMLRVLVRALSKADMRGALAAFRWISDVNEQPVRLAGAQHIGDFRGDKNILGFIRTWIEKERDDQVRQALQAALHKKANLKSWDSGQMIGPADVSTVNQDSSKAWAPKNMQGGRQWVELKYHPARQIDQIRIHEVCRGGAVVEVYAIDESGRRHRVWHGDDPVKKTGGGVFPVKFPLTPYRVKGVRIVLDTNKSSGWNEIDAVEIVGPQGRAWAIGAKASSTYGQ